jgi:hypothetical protein
MPDPIGEKFPRNTTYNLPDIVDNFEKPLIGAVFLFGKKVLTYVDWWSKIE